MTTFGKVVVPSSTLELALSPEGSLMATVRKWSGRESRALRQALRMSVRMFAPYLGVSERTISKWEAGQVFPSPEMQAALDTALQRCDAETLSRFVAAIERPHNTESVVGQVIPEDGGPAPAGMPQDDELDALELARRVEASDVSEDTLDRLERSADELAMSYARTPPEDLIPRVRQHLAYVGHLANARKTLKQQRRLLVVGGWLSLLAATLHIDLRQRAAAGARLTTAAGLARHADHDEIAAWCLETQAWDVLTEGDFQAAVKLSQQAQALAPTGSSAHLQATAQEGRAWARMGLQKETRAVLNRLSRLTSPLSTPKDPEHHYQYDPSKAISYTATTLAWAGDPAAEAYAREAVLHLERAPDGIQRPRRIASAKLDLSLALLTAGRPDEASAHALSAICSGRIVPSNRWRAAEIVTAVQAARIPEATDLHDAFQTYCVPGRRPDE